MNMSATNAAGVHGERGTHPIDVTAVSGDDMVWPVVNGVRRHRQYRSNALQKSQAPRENPTLRRRAIRSVWGGPQGGCIPGARGNRGIL